MSFYSVKTPWWLRQIFPRNLIWKMPPEAEPSVYLTFDDGPHPEATVFALDMLREYKAHASFFCIGKNVAQHPEIYQRILADEHTAGNHTCHHLNGWKTSDAAYAEDIEKASAYIHSRNFRPPYGRIKLSQVKNLSKEEKPWRIFMWDILSGDFDATISGEKCLDNVVKNLEPGSIVVFHDSAKAFTRMRFALPGVLAFCAKKDWKLKALPEYA